MKFPFLFGRAFIEAPNTAVTAGRSTRFPFLFGRAFIEANETQRKAIYAFVFPFLFGRAFIEARRMRGLGLGAGISLPFRKGFH